MSLYAAIFSGSNPEGIAEHVQAHLDYLGELREQGIVLANGRLQDSDLGLVILRGDSLAQVREWLDADPFVKHGVKHIEVYAWDATTAANVRLG